MRFLKFVSFALAAVLFGGCGLVNSSKDTSSPRYKKILNRFLASQPVAVNVSPDGKYVITKLETNGGFRVSILDSVTKREVYFTDSKNTQLELTWRPDSKAIVFQEIAGENRPLYIFDLQSGKRAPLDAPVSRTALPSLCWNPSGTRLAYFEGDWRTGTLWAINPTNSNDQALIADNISTESEYTLSPDGKRIAFSNKADRGILALVNIEDLSRKKYRICDGEVRKLAWSPDGALILAAARGSEDQFFKLVGVDAQNGSFTVVAKPQADVSTPLWLPDGRSFIYHANSNGITRAYLATRGSDKVNPIGPINGVLTITHFDAAGTTAYAHFSSLTTPPLVGRISLADGNWTELYSCPTAEQCRCPEPEFITLHSRDGTAVPVYQWRAAAQTNAKPSALIVVHGGLHTQTYPTWEAYIGLMTDLGCNVIAVNHRGSSGIGQKYETLEGDPVWDIIAARDYAAENLKVDASRIFMTGISTGSRLISLAAAYGADIGGLALVSWPGQEAEVERKFAKTFPVLEFHGDLDPVLSTKAARQEVNSFFATKGPNQFNVQFWSFSDEGHFFYRSDSRAKVCSEISKLIQPAE